MKEEEEEGKDRRKRRSDSLNRGKSSVVGSIFTLTGLHRYIHIYKYQNWDVTNRIHRSLFFFFRGSSLADLAQFFSIPQLTITLAAAIGSARRRKEGKNGRAEGV